MLSVLTTKNIHKLRDTRKLWEELDLPIPLILMTVWRMFAYVQPCLHYIGAVFVNQLYLKRKKNIEKNKQEKGETEGG